jgi:hypothetical protein
MITDDIAAAVPYARELIEKSTIVRVPFQLSKRFTFDDEVGDGWTEASWLDNGFRDYVTPQVYEWARPTLSPMILVGNGGARETGFLYVDSAPTFDRMFREKRPDVHSSIVMILFLASPMGAQYGADHWDMIAGICNDGVVTISMSEMDRMREAAGRNGGQFRKLIGPCGENSTDQQKRFDLFTRAVNAVMVSFALMNCRNVKMDEAEIPAKVQAHRVRRGKLPLYRYHVLNIRPQSKTARTRTAGRPDKLDVAIHMVRGHFKEYGKSGLFGKHRGIYWWTPHLAGTAPRVVDKSYVIH